MEKISLNLSNMKFMLYGDAENEPKEGDMNKLVEEVRSSRQQQSGRIALDAACALGDNFHSRGRLTSPFPHVHLLIVMRVVVLSSVRSSTRIFFST